jgi:hypothetical protein
MSGARRRYLLYFAAYCAVFMVILVHFILQLTEPPTSNLIAYPVSLAVASLFSAPLWLPVVIPARFAVLSRVVQWICALLLVIHIWTFGDFIRNNIVLWRTGHHPSVVVTTSSVVGVLGSLVAIAALIWPNKSLQPTAAAPVS